MMADLRERSSTFPFHLCQKNMIPSLSIDDEMAHFNIMLL